MNQIIKTIMTVGLLCVVSMACTPSKNCDYWVDGVKVVPDTDELKGQVTSINCSDTTNEGAVTFRLYPSLQTLAFNNTKITSIDLSSNHALTSLEAINNELMSVDLSNNPLLTYVNVAVNKITSIDVSNSPSLVEFHVETNNLTSIDVSNNPLLYGLAVSRNNLASLDVSNNGLLEILYANDSNLTSIDLSNNTLLKSVYLDDNNLTDITSMLALNNLNIVYLRNNFGIPCSQLTQLDSIVNTNAFYPPSSCAP